MGILRVIQYAEAQARIRARVGDMPDTTQWRRVSDARDLDALVARMRENGLQYWIKDLPRAPDTVSMEQHLKARLAEFFVELERLLPRHRAAIRNWLQAGAGLIFLDQPCQWRLWWDELATACRRLPGDERARLIRIHAMVSEHLYRIHNASPEMTADLDLEWQWRNELASKLRAALGGNPFHIGLVMVYGLLQAIQFERSRALLVSLSRGWEPPDLLRGLA